MIYPEETMSHDLKSHKSNAQYYVASIVTVVLVALALANYFAQS